MHDELNAPKPSNDTSAWCDQSQRFCYQYADMASLFVKFSLCFEWLGQKWDWAGTYLPHRQFLIDTKKIWMQDAERGLSILSQEVHELQHSHMLAQSGIESVCVAQLAQSPERKGSGINC